MCIEDITTTFLEWTHNARKDLDPSVHPCLECPQCRTQLPLGVTPQGTAAKTRRRMGRALLPRTLGDRSPRPPCSLLPWPSSLQTPQDQGGLPSWVAMPSPPPAPSAISTKLTQGRRLPHPERKRKLAYMGQPHGARHKSECSSRDRPRAGMRFKPTAEKSRSISFLAFVYP